MVALDGKVIVIYPRRDMNVCTKFHGHQSKCFEDICKKTKNLIQASFMSMRIFLDHIYIAQVVTKNTFTVVLYSSSMKPEEQLC